MFLFRPKPASLAPVPTALILEAASGRLKGPKVLEDGQPILIHLQQLKTNMTEVIVTLYLFMLNQ